MVKTCFYIYIYIPGNSKVPFFLAIWPEWTVRRNSTWMGGIESMWSKLGFREYHRISQPFLDMSLVNLAFFSGKPTWNLWCAHPAACRVCVGSWKQFSFASAITSSCAAPWLHIKNKILQISHSLVWDGPLWLQQRDDCPTESHRTKPFYNFIWFDLLSNFLFPPPFHSRVARTRGHARAFLERSA